MSTAPETLMLHTVSNSRWTDATALRAAIEDRLPDLSLRVARTPDESRERVESAEVVVTTSLPDDVLGRAEYLRWVQALSSGVDFFDFEALRERDVALTNVAGVHAEPIAEQVLGYLLAFERGIVEGMRNQHRGVWERYEGGELRGKTLGIVGLGAVGTRTAELSRAFGMTVLATKRDPSTAPDVVDDVYGPDGLHEALIESDYVVVACPLTADTRDLIGREELGCMKESAVLVNVARGPIVDEAALTEGLQQRVIRGAALDVFEHEPLAKDSPLWDLSNIVLTPHMAGSSPAKTSRTADVFAENYAAYRDGRDLPTRVV
ncbi:D-2-hydroxyacid dehydrogenase [Halobacteriales archaeon QH_6_64_20]|nr:MAG: D-2-hydroxyacid dehydrogenase [Halobacteriales archaeon QH_6_64_20]